MRRGTPYSLITPLGRRAFSRYTRIFSIQMIGVPLYLHRRLILTRMISELHEGTAVLFDKVGKDQ